MLVLGGTGFLGPHLVEAALASGYEVTLFNRGKTNPHLFPELEKLQGDRDGDLGELRGRKWDVVVDNSGYVPRVVRASAELLADNVEHYLFVSTISVYADLSRPGVNEDAPLAVLEEPGSEEVAKHYGALKALCESAVAEVMPGRSASVRPGLIVGPGDPTDRFTYWPARADRGGTIVGPGNPGDPIQFIDVRDLAPFMLTMLDQRLVGAYNALGPNPPVTIGALVEACRSASGVASEVVWAPLDALEAEQVMPWMDMPVWVPAQGEYAGAGLLDVSKSMAAGLTFRPLEDTVTATLEWWRSQPEDRRAQPRAGLSIEREAALLARLRDG